MGMPPASCRRRVRHLTRNACIVFLCFGVALVIKGVAGETSDVESAARERENSTSVDVEASIEDDTESYDAAAHFQGAKQQVAPTEWVRTSDDAMPVMPFEIIDVAAGLAETEGSKKGNTADKNKRADYQELASLLHSQAATIDSFHGREDLHPDGKCEAEIKQLCAATEMENTHVSNLKFTTVNPGGGAEKKDNEDAESAEDTEKPAITERRRILLQDLTAKESVVVEHLSAPDPWGVDEDPPAAPVEASEKDKRIFDLEAKVNALAELMENTQGGADAVATIAHTKRPHRPYKSYFECVHANIVEVHQRRAKHVVTPACRAEVRETYQRRFTDIRKDAELMSVCGGGHKATTHKVDTQPDPDDDDDAVNNAARGEAVAGGDISKFCADVKPGLGLVFRCLKSHKATLDSECAKVVGFRQIEQAADISLDAPLALMCEEDRVKLCAGTKWGGGATEQCLKDNRAELSTQCKLEVFRREVEESEDIRYDGFLAEVCAGDKNAFCGDVTPGEGRILACLEAHVGAAKFSSECRQILDRRVVRRAADWRLDFALRKACASTVKSMCHAELDAAKTKVSSSGTVLECLKRKFDDGDVDDASCASEVTKKMAAASGDIREDTALTLACKGDLQKHCGGVAPGESRLWRCLAEHRKEGYGKECEAKLFERETWMSGDWRFKYALASECASEAQVLCQGVAAGGGRVIRCLQEKLDDPRVGKACREAVFGDQQRSHSDVRLHKELSSSCDSDLKLLCAGVEPGEGRVVRCLKDKRAEVTKPDCRNALLRLMMSHADNYLLDAPLAAACHDDVIAHCSTIEPGHGRVHECLRAVPDVLSQACLDAEIGAESNESEDIRLKPQILRACSSSAATLCADVKPGHGALLECLLAKSGDDEMDGSCAKKLTRFSKRANKHMAFNNMVKKHCPLEAARLCDAGADAVWQAERSAAAADKSVADESASSEDTPKEFKEPVADESASSEDTPKEFKEPVADESASSEDTPKEFKDPLTCLVRSIAKVEIPECATALRKTVLKSFKAFRVGTPATKMCDGSAEKLCGATKELADFQAPGSVLGCLQRNAGEIGDACWQAVATTVEDGDKKGNIGSSPDHDKIVERVRAALLEEVSGKIARGGDGVSAAAARTVSELRKKADSLGTVLALVVLALVGVAFIAFLALRRAFTLLGRTSRAGKAAGSGKWRGAHNV